MKLKIQGKMGLAEIISRFFWYSLFQFGIFVIYIMTTGTTQPENMHPDEAFRYSMTFMAGILFISGIVVYGQYAHRKHLFLIQEALNAKMEEEKLAKKQQRQPQKESQSNFEQSNMDVALPQSLNVFADTVIPEILDVYHEEEPVVQAVQEKPLIREPAVRKVEAKETRPKVRVRFKVR